MNAMAGWPCYRGSRNVMLYCFMLTLTKRSLQVTWLTAGMLPENQAALIRFDKWYTFSGGRSKLFGFSYESTAEVSRVLLVKSNKMFMNGSKEQIQMVRIQTQIHLPLHVGI